MDEERVKKLVRELIIEVGEDPTREGLRETPKRIASMYKEIFANKNAESTNISNKYFLFILLSHCCTLTILLPN